MLKFTDKRQKLIRLWFDMRLAQQDLVMDNTVLYDMIYIESQCPKYENLQTVKHQFNE